MRLVGTTIAGLLLSLLSVTGYSAHDLLRPLNINALAPVDDVPLECARFFSPAGWGEGAWDDGRPHELHITSIETDCSASVLYGYGGWNHDGTGDWFSLSAEIKRGRLIVFIPEHDALATYEISDDGMMLSGVWEKTDESAVSYVSLKRLE